MARKLVVEYETRRNRPAQIASENQEGFDVSSQDAARAVTRLIEVKGLQQRWVGDATVALTRPQFDAQKNAPPPGCEYWLYVVDGLGNDSPMIIPLRRPAVKVERFYFQAQDWMDQVDVADAETSGEVRLGTGTLPIVGYENITVSMSEQAFLTRYPMRDLSDIVPPGGYLRCTRTRSGDLLPARGSLVMVFSRGLQAVERQIVIGEFRWSVRENIDGKPEYVEVTLRPKSSDPSIKPVSFKVPFANWSAFRPFAVCEPVNNV